MGNHFHGLHHQITNIDQTKCRHHGSGGQIEQVHPFYSRQIDLQGNRYRQHIHEGDIQTTWYA
jgi:hypothetical protein